MAADVGSLGELHALLTEVMRDEIQTYRDNGATVQQPIWQASFILQATETIPEDYADDHYWLK